MVNEWHGQEILVWTPGREIEIGVLMDVAEQLGLHPGQELTPEQFLEVCQMHRAAAEACWALESLKGD